MDCRGFRKQHLAYLDDTLPGDDMAAAQRHIMSCDNCAAHDTLVRRSLMLVRNMQVLEPSVEFRQRMQARLNETRAETQRQRFLLAEAEAQPKERFAFRQPFVLTAIAATFIVAGATVWRQQSLTAPRLMSTQAAAVTLASPRAGAPTALAPAVADTTQQEIHLAPGIVQAMSTGNPMWPAALMVDDAAARFVNVGFSEVKSAR